MPSEATVAKSHPRLGLVVSMRKYTLATELAYASTAGEATLMPCCALESMGLHLVDSLAAGGALVGD